MSAESTGLFGVGRVWTRASTGPRSIERGKLCWPGATACQFTPLQRGRAQLSAESQPLVEYVRHDPRASTGPRSIERGKTKAFFIARRAVIASTGPRSIERGKSGTSAPNIGRNGLQRGRAQLSAERKYFLLLLNDRLNASTGPRSIERGKSVSPNSSMAATQRLQRGRAQLSAESGARRPCSSGSLRFNGAALN